ncbi:unnamed protein product, partial [Chrysoparadoxa australica]
MSTTTHPSCSSLWLWLLALGSPHILRPAKITWHPPYASARIVYFPPFALQATLVATMRMALKDCLRLNKDLRWGKLHEKSLTGPKWKRFAQLLNNRHNRKFRKYYDVSSLQLSNFTKRHINTFKNNLQVRQAMRQMYGGISHKTMRKIWGGSRPKPSMECLKIMESRLDVTLMRINVVPTMQASRQLIAHGQVRVNQQENKKPSTQLKRGDIISFHPG